MAEIVSVETALEKAGDLLAAGGIAAIPTETVYGLAADATNGEAVARIFEAKGRPHFNPLIAHVCDWRMAEVLAVFNPLAQKLMEAFWPGPLTLVLPVRSSAGLHPLVTSGLDTVALRMPRGFAQDLIKYIGGPLAAPSANSSGRISATTAQAVQRDLGERIDLIIDGGQTPVGLESTIVKTDNGALRLLRPGGLSAEDIEAVAGVKLLRGATAGIEAPGQLESHYAPHARLRLNARDVRPGEALLAFGPDRAGPKASNAQAATVQLNLSETGDLRIAASNLFSHLQALDLTGVATIAVEPVPHHGLGEAINDRLRRAAAPRPSSF